MEESTPGRFISLHGSILRALYRRRTRERITSVSAAWSTRQLQERSWRMRGCPQGNDGHSKRRSVSAEEFSNPGDLSRQLIAGNRKRFIRVDDVPTYVKKRFRIEADPFERTWEDPSCRGAMAYRSRLPPRTRPSCCDEIPG